MKLSAALMHAAQSGLPRQEAQWLLMQVLNCDRAWLITHDDDALSAAQQAQFEDWLKQRLDEVPLAYLVGHKNFHGLDLQVNRATLVPRPDTEVLVDWALALLAASALPRPRVLDLGTGSGAIALAVKHRWPQAEVTAVDVSTAALQVAQANAQRLQLDIRFLSGSWFDAVAAERFDLILSNPPYIAAGDPHLPALRHEPLGALTPGGDGLSDLQHLARTAPQHLNPGACLLLEHGFDQAEDVALALQQAGFSHIQNQRDLGGQPRCTGGIFQAQ